MTGPRASRAVVRAAAVATAGLALGAAFVFGASELRVSRTRAVPARDAVRPDEASLARGRHLAVHVALCTFCHGDDLGGRETADDPWIGRLAAPNLTTGPGGVGARYTDADFDRAIRDGVTPSGRPLLLMPSHYFHRMSDADVAAIVAWVRTRPPVARAWPEPRVGPLTRLALVTGLAPELVSAERIDAFSEAGGDAARPAAPSDLGAHLVDVASCRVCHHADLSGGLHPLALPGELPPSDLRPSGPLATWSRDDFVRAMREGVTPDGRRLSPDAMPWPRFAGMTDAELEAIFAYLRADAAPSDRGRGATTTE